jgi:hypothetical protein
MRLAISAAIAVTLLVVVVAIVFGEPFDCKKECGQGGGFIIKDYWGFPHCLCQAVR